MSLRFGLQSLFADAVPHAELKFHASWDPKNPNGSFCPISFHQNAGLSLRSNLTGAFWLVPISSGKAVRVLNIIIWWPSNIVRFIRHSPTPVFARRTIVADIPWAYFINWPALWLRTTPTTISYAASESNTQFAWVIPTWGNGFMKIARLYDFSFCPQKHWNHVPSSDLKVAWL